MSEPIPLEEEPPVDIGALRTRVTHLELLLIDRARDLIDKGNKAEDLLQSSAAGEARGFLIDLQDHAAWILILHILRGGERGPNQVGDLLRRVQFPARMRLMIRHYDQEIRQLDEGRGLHDVFQAYVMRHSN